LHTARNALAILTVAVLLLSGAGFVYYARALSVSQVTATSQNASGNAITGLYTVLYDSTGSIILASGNTPVTFSTVPGMQYLVQVSGNSSCAFISWSDGVASNPRPFTAALGALSFTAVYSCGPTSQLTVDTQLDNGSAITGFYTVLYQNGTIVSTGYSPAQFTVSNGQVYTVEVDGYGSYYFQYWLDTASVNIDRNVTTSANLSITAVMCNGPPGTCPDPIPKYGITVYAHRIPASYWDPCFATACSAGTGPGAAMYFELYDSSGTLIQTGYANEQGYTFSGLNPNATYYVYPDDCNLCHGSTHNVVFQYWGANSSTARPIAATVGTSLDAWYSCTNGCN
jgi:hypothetical protein